MKNLKGITLIALIITVVVLLILAMVTIREITGDGIIARAREASFKAMMSGYQEQVELYMVDKRIGMYLNDTIKMTDINAGATDREPIMDIKEILGTDVQKGYEEKIAIEMGELYYVPTNMADNKVKNEVKWCFELGIKVKGYSSYDDYQFDTAQVSDGSYEEVNGIYVNTPDLTGFSKAHTYYVTYDATGGSETIGGRIVEEAPDNWYNYKSKIWANVVTKYNGASYWVWIPRYAYKITYYTDETLETPSEEVTQYGKVDVKFLSKENVYKDAEGKETQYTEETLAAEGYKLSDAFSWGNEEDKVPLAGYWVSKYEVSTAASFNIEKTIDGGVKITKINNCVAPYNYYLDGELQHSGSDLYTFENLEPLKTHEIKIEDAKGGTVIRKVYIDDEIIKDSVPKTLPDVSGFKNTNAYYVTYDATGGSEKIGDKILFDDQGNPTNAPEGWYNYQNKIWANIVTASEELTETEKADIKTATDKKVAYWVWIPRYEYKIIGSPDDSDYVEGDTGCVSINFIDTNTTTPTREGYKISDAFNWDGKQLAGYWVSKYEVSN